MIYLALVLGVCIGWQCCCVFAAAKRGDPHDES